MSAKLVEETCGQVEARARWLTPGKECGCERVLSWWKKPAAKAEAGARCQPPYPVFGEPCTWKSTVSKHG